MKRVLIITCSYDNAAARLTDFSDDASSFFRFDIDLAEKYQILVTEKSWRLMLGSDFISYENVASIYYRLPALCEEGVIDRSQLKRELICTLEGIVESFEGLVLNRPSTVYRLGNRLLQMKLARDSGFPVPESLVTNNGAVSAEFCREPSRVIHSQGLAGLRREEAPQGLLRNLTERDAFDRTLAQCPVHFCRNMPYEFRAAAVFIGEVCFCAFIFESSDGDWHGSGELLYRKGELPPQVCGRCIAMLRKYHLYMGKFEFAVKDGEYYFLELKADQNWFACEEKLYSGIGKQLFQCLTASRR